MPKTTYHDFAVKFVEARYGQPTTLRYYREEWWIWNQGRYRVQSDSNLRSRITQWLDEEGEPSTESSVRELRSAIKSLSYVTIDDSLDMPLCIEVEYYDETCNYLAFQDQIVDLDVLLITEAKQPRKLPTPNWFSPVVMSYNYNPEATCPHFRAFLDKVLPNKVSQEVMQEWFGYCLTTDTSFRAMMILYGESGTGKSTLSNILEAMIGKENRSAVPLECFWNRFSPQEMVGKLVNFCGDSGKIDQLAEGVIKRFTGGDTILVDRKYKQPISIKMTAKIVVATNTFPQVQDTSEAMWTRFIVVPMDTVIPDHEVDRSLLGSEKSSWPLRKELPGIFNWAIEGLKRLRRQGHFTVSPQLVQAKREARHENCSLSWFVEERCTESSYSETTSRFMHEYQCFCENQGLEAFSAPKVGRILRKLLPGLEKKKLGPRGQQQMYYVGVQIHVPRSPVA